MSPKWLASQNVFWNIIFRDSRSLLHFNNGLFKTMDALQEKDIIVELVGKEFHDPRNMKNIVEIKHEVFKSLIRKLFHYSSVTHSSVQANKLINSISSVTFSNSSHTIFKDLLEFFSNENDIDGINIIKQINYYENYLKDTDSLKEAMEVWKKGKILNSFNMFSKLYDISDLGAQKEILRTLHGLVFYSIEKEGKALVNSVIKCSAHFCHDKNEFSVMICVWYALFTSEIYEDRCLADDILFHNSYLPKYLENYIPSLGYLFLKNNELTHYQRLIETSLRYNMDSSVGLLLRNLFNYYYRAGYVSGCSAVYKCCMDLNIKLTHDQLYKYQTLQSSDFTKAKQLEIPLPEEMKYKF